MIMFVADVKIAPANIMMSARETVIPVFWLMVIVLWVLSIFMAVL